jgi:hypothetical protein
VRRNGSSGNLPQRDDHGLGDRLQQASEPWFFGSTRSEEGFPVLFDPILFGITQNK